MEKEKSSISVFIVEDDPVLSLILSRMVQKMNFEISGTTETGKDSIEQILERRPSIILMDISLKDDIDGTMVAGEVVKQYKPTIIYITGNSDSLNRNKAKEHGYHDYLVKPVNYEQLSHSIKTALG